MVYAPLGGYVEAGCLTHGTVRSTLHTWNCDGTTVEETEVGTEAMRCKLRKRTPFTNGYPPWQPWRSDEHRNRNQVFEGH